MTRGRRPARPDAVDVELAAVDVDYYAEIHERLPEGSEERAAFEAAVDAAYAELQERRARAA